MITEAAKQLGSACDILATTMRASSSSRRSRISRRRNGTRSPPSICRPPSTPPAPAVPGMKAKKWGRCIINTASAHALVASGSSSRPMTSAKHGIAGLTKTVALETATFGITEANAICPGYVWTPLVEKQHPRHHGGAQHDPRAGDERCAADRAAHQAVPVTVDEVASLAVYLAGDMKRVPSRAALSPSTAVGPRLEWPGPSLTFLNRKAAVRAVLGRTSDKHPAR